MFAGIALVTGAAINLFVAWGIGYAGVPESGGRFCFFLVEGQVVLAEDVGGPGYRVFGWETDDPEHAALVEYLQDKGLTTISGKVDPSYLHYDSPEMIPTWSSLRDPANIRPINPGFLNLHPVTYDIEIGWPFRSFSMWGYPEGGPRGGACINWKTLPPSGSLRVLPLTPRLPGVLWGTLFWAATSLALGWIARVGVRRTVGR
jgi:hypothetical protein